MTLALLLLGCSSGRAEKPVGPAPEAGKGVRLVDSTPARALGGQVRQTLGTARSEANGILGFVRSGDRVKPLLDTAAVRRSRGPATVELPLRGDGEVRVADRKSELVVGFRIAGAPAWEIAVADELGVHDAPGAPRAWLQRVHVEGVEDYVLFRERPAKDELRYRIDVSRVAGMRLVSNELEFLDQDGAPRLRVTQPYLVDATGERRDAALELEGCAYDADPRMPWGRPVTAPGAASCELVVRWNGAGVSYPAVLDPSWTTTCSPLFGGDGLVRMKDGRVMYGAGQNRAQIYDPKSATWAVTQPGATSGMMALSDGRVLGLSSIYSPTTGKWTPVTPPRSLASPSEPPYSYGSWIALDGGKALHTGVVEGTEDPDVTPPVHGGYASYLFDPITSTWSPVLPRIDRSDPALLMLGEDRVLVIGGTSGKKCEKHGDIYVFPEASNRVDVFDTRTGEIRALAGMLEPRHAYDAVELPDGKVLVVGNRERCAAYCSIGDGIGGCRPQTNQYVAELYDPVSNSWRAVGTEIVGHLELLPDGNVFIVDSAPALFEPSSGNWYAVPNYIHSFQFVPSAAALDSGGILIAGEYYASGVDTELRFAADIYTGGRLGQACTTSATCDSGYCVDGVCCNRRCDGSCEACSIAKKGPRSVQGLCGPIPDLADPDSECPSVGVCQPGTCNGKGGCLSPRGRLCGTDICGQGPDDYILSRAECNDAGACISGVYYCTDDTYCTEGCYRVTPIPPPLRAQGEACTSSSECASGYCSDSVCCDRSCYGCSACRGNLKQGGGPDGVCGARKAGPNSVACPRSVFGCEGLTGECDGNGACAKKDPTGTPCGETSCSGSTTFSGQVCNAARQCVTGSGTCGAYTCANGVCNVCCGSNSDCAPGNVCKDCACVPPLGAGKMCSKAEQCASGHCADGRCCDSACSGPCEACDLAGKEGTCSPLAPAACPPDAGSDGATPDGGAGTGGATPDGGAGTGGETAGTGGAGSGGEPPDAGAGSGGETAGTGGAVGSAGAGSGGTSDAGSGGASAGSDSGDAAAGAGSGGTAAGTAGSGTPPTNPPDDDDSGCSMASRARAPAGGAGLLLFALLALRGRRRKLGEPKGQRGRLVQGALIMSLGACNTSEHPASPVDAGGGADRSTESAAGTGGADAGSDASSSAESGSGTAGNDAGSDTSSSAESGDGTAGNDAGSDASSGAESGGGTAGSDAGSDANSGADSGDGTAGSDADSGAESGTGEKDGAAGLDATADSCVGSKVVVRQIAAGAQHTCALLSNGAVRCWGWGIQGRLGYGNTNSIGDDEAPASAGDVNVGGAVQQIAVGRVHTCALLTTGAVRCWGYNGYGQLGYGNTETLGDNETPASAGDVNVGGAVQQIAARGDFTCALLTTGAVRCWGASGGLGYGNTKNIGDDEAPASAGDVNVGGSVQQIAAGGVHTCALLINGAVRCWGWGGEGQLGYANTSTIGDNEAPASAGNVNVGGSVQQVAANVFHTCALLTNGAVRCWGWGVEGMLGYGNTNPIGDNETPASAGDVNVGASVQQIAAGRMHTCALLTNGAVRCWGDSFVGQLGYGNRNTIGDDEAPVSAGDVNVGGSVQQIAVGDDHACALLTNGAVRCWGDGYYGQLGYGNTNDVGDYEVPASAGDVRVRDATSGAECG